MSPLFFRSSSMDFHSLLFSFCEVDLQRMSEGTVVGSFLFPLALLLTSMCSLVAVNVGVEIPETLLLC